MYVCIIGAKIWYWFKISSFQIVKHPKALAMVVYEEGTEMISNEGLGMIMGVLPYDQIYLLGVFFLYGMISARIVFLLMPLFVFYVTLGVMLVSTLQMFYTKQKSNDAAAMAKVLKTYDVGVDVDETKSQYKWNSKMPYFVFFVCLPILIISFSVANKNFIPCSEICVVSFVLAAVCFSALSDSHDLVALLAMMCNFLSALPTFFHHFPDIPVLSKVLHVISAPLFSIELGFGFQINVGIPSLSHVVIGVFFVIMAAQKSWKGTYQVLLPHLVCYFWWNAMTSFFPYATWMGLGRATVGYFILPVLIPLALVAAIPAFVYAIYYLSFSNVFGKLLITLMLIAVPLIMKSVKSMFKLDKKSDSKVGTAMTVIMVICGLLSLIPLAFIKLPSGKVGKFNLTFADYQTLCVDSHVNTAPEMMECSLFNGQKVVWNGVFKGATVTKTENAVLSIFSSLPSFMSEPLTCLYGERFGDCEGEGMEGHDQIICRLFTSSGRLCHLKNHDTYTFNVKVSLPDAESTLIANLEAGDSFKHTIAALEKGDHVEITGNLVDHLGSNNIQMKLKHLTCTSRQLMVMNMIEEEDEEDKFMRSLNEAVGVAFHFFWYPLVEYVNEEA